MNITAEPSQMVKLAAMECASSCVMTGLKLAGRDEKLLLLNQWYLQYMNRTLLSGRNVRMLDLEYIYGIRKQLIQGGEEDLRLRFARKNMALFICVPSRLNYFPEQLLTLEESGFDHYILLTGFNEETQRFRVVDPITDFIGELSTEELLHASVKPGFLYYFIMEFPPHGSFLPPEASTLFLHEAQKNLDHYAASDILTGGKAIEGFCTDLSDSTQWSAAERTVWIRQNNITFSSIVKTRELVWQSFCHLRIMKPEQVEQGGKQMKMIVKAWMAANFLLIKYGRHSDNSSIIDKLVHKMAGIRQMEIEFLQFICATGRELCEG